jgi:hypothetical protein
VIPASPSPDVDRLRAAGRANRYRLVAAGLALAAGLVVFLIAHELFPYHSSNHDEGVYLQQASMLLEGQLRLTPGSEPLGEAVHPWFFVESETGLYPKYTPVPAAVFALGKLAGDFRLALLGIAALNVGLAYEVVAAAFDRRTGLLAATIMAGAPLFLFTSSAFLPYAPTTALNLLFALAYVRSVRRADVRYAALAGGAIGLAFFARQYTAVLFATPFVVHALWRLRRAVPEETVTVTHLGVTAGVGLVFVGLTLAYNATLTGSPFSSRTRRSHRWTGSVSASAASSGTTSSIPPSWRSGLTPSSSGPWRQTGSPPARWVLRLPPSAWWPSSSACVGTVWIPTPP